MGEAEIVKAILELLKRVTIKGEEVPVYNICSDWLNQKAKSVKQESNNASCE